MLGCLKLMGGVFELWGGESEGMGSGKGCGGRSMGSWLGGGRLRG